MKQTHTKSAAISLLKKLAYDNFRIIHPTFPVHCIAIPKYNDNTTNGLTKCIIDFIELSGGQAERINSTGRFIDNRKTFVDVIGRKRSIGTAKWIKPNTTNGSSDISATIQGRAVKIEVKCKATGDRYQSTAQKSYQQAIEAAGGVYIIATDFQTFYEWYVKHFGHENK